MNNKTLLSVALLVALVVVGSAVAYAQPTVTRVGVIVNVDTPDRFPVRVEDIATDALREFRSTVDDLRGINVVEQDTMFAAQRQLDVDLNLSSSTRDMQAVSNLLELDRLIIIDLHITGTFSFSLTTKAFNNNTNETLILNARTTSDNFAFGLVRVIANIIDDLVPFLN